MNYLAIIAVVVSILVVLINVTILAIVVKLYTEYAKNEFAYVKKALRKLKEE